MRYLLVYEWGWSKQWMYYNDLKAALDCLESVKRDGGKGKIYGRGENGQFDKVMFV